MVKQGYVMSPSELKALRDERSFTNSMLNQAQSENYGAGSRGSQLDRERLSSAAKHYAKQEDAYSPRALRGAHKDKVAKEAAKLENEFKEGMLTQKETETASCAYQQLAWERRNTQKILQWKQLQRRLNPGDPGASNIERLRRER